MKFKMSKEWCLEMAKREGDSEVGAGWNTPDIIHQEDGKWYFWIESWHDRYGPYDTKEECEKQFKWYCENILGT